MLTSRRLASWRIAARLASWRWPACAGLGLRHRLAGLRGQILLPQALELRVLRVQSAQIGIGLTGPSRPVDHRAGSASGGLRSMYLLSAVGSMRPPRAWRAYFRMARLMATSALARSVRDSSALLTGRGGSRNAEASSPQSSALASSATTAWPAGLIARRRHPDRLVLAGLVEFGERGAIIALRGGTRAGGRQSCTDFGRQADNRRGLLLPGRRGRRRPRSPRPGRRAGRAERAGLRNGG